MKRTTAARALTAKEASRARWSRVVSLPIVPAAAANLPDGKIVFWSAEDRFGFSQGGAQTYTTTFDPASGKVQERLVTETGHNMFCPGTAVLPDGRVLVNGGSSSRITSLYNPATGTWTRSADMNIPRAYEGTAPLADGSVLTLGGSWNGGLGNKHGEIWTDGQGWRRLPGVPIDPFLAAVDGFAMDSHLWLFPTGNGKVLYAGPNVDMRWISTEGDGSVTPAGRRGTDAFSVNGNALVVDAGRILKLGGAPSYGTSDANNNVFSIEVGADAVVRKLASMAYRRKYQNSVVLPNGQVAVIGGATAGGGFQDSYAVLTPELFDPQSETFFTLPPMQVPRTYHSVALLLQDGRVLSAGGGLCRDCPANHPDLQILSPPYLFNADGSDAVRPSILSAPTQANHGTTIQVTTNSSIAAFSIVRSAATTHATNNDQRRLSLTFRKTTANTYLVNIPSNPGWAVPGPYMLFAMNDQGVPSVARMVRVGAQDLIKLRPVDSQLTASGSAVRLPLAVLNRSESALRYAASGLPKGLQLDASSGVIAGTPTEVGRSLVEVSVTDGSQTVSTTFPWTVSQRGSTRYVRFEALSEVAGGGTAAAADLGLLDDGGRSLSGAFTATADSMAPNLGPERVLDNNPDTVWTTNAASGYPHWLQVDLGGAFHVAGLRYLPPKASATGHVARFRIYLSQDGVQWGAPVADGNLATLGAALAEKTVYFNNVARGKSATQSSTDSGGVASRAVDGNTNGAWSAGSVTQTTSSAQPWWEVDLGATHQIAAARLWNRTDMGSERLSNFHVLTSDKPMTGRTLASLLADPAVTANRTYGLAGNTLLVPLGSVKARYVRVQLQRTNSLHLAEVEVFGRPNVNRAPTLTEPVASDVSVGDTVRLGLVGHDADGDALTFSASGLPSGLGIDAVTGFITGIATQAGRFTVQASVTDSRGGRAAATFVWTVLSTGPVIAPIAAPAIPAGDTARYAADVTASGGAEFVWTFGDGSLAPESTASPAAEHTFSRPGVYVVTLTVRDGSGLTTSRQFLQAVTGYVSGGRGQSSGALAYEPRPGGGRLWVVNPDHGSVSVFDATTFARVAQVAVGEKPRALAVAPNGRVWVSDQATSTLRAISTETLTILQTVSLPRASSPYGVVVSDEGKVYVALEATGRVLKLDASGNVKATLAAGPSPRHLALTVEGERLLVSRFVTRPQPGESTASVGTSIDGVQAGGEVLVVDADSMALRSTMVLQHSDRRDAENAGRGVPNYLGAPALSPDGQSAWIPSKQDNIQRGMLRDGQPLNFQNTVRAIASRIDLATESEDYPARVDLDNAGLASAATFHPNGAYLFVALETSREVAVLDAYGQRELFRLDVGRAPQAVALSNDGRTLFVHNFMDRRVGVYDLTRLLSHGDHLVPLTRSLETTSSEVLAPAVLRGKQLFYDARDTRLARDGYISCASCHNDGGTDGRTWDLTGFGEGLRNTISLRGRAGTATQGRLHWSANFDEVQDFEGQIRTLAGGSGLMTDAAFSGSRAQPLGAPKAGQSSDLDALAAYLGSLDKFDASPYRRRDGGLTAGGVAGQTVFLAQCASCHGGDAFTDSARGATHNVGTLKPSSGQRLGGTLNALDTPTLRDVWATAPYLHDGSAARIEDAIQAHTGLSLSPTELADVTAFTRQIGSGTAPVSSIALGSGLTGTYFATDSLTTPVLSRNEVINFDWSVNPVPPNVNPKLFSARWEGKLRAPAGGTYVLQTVADDGIRVWLGSTLVIDDWGPHAPLTRVSAPIQLAAGSYTPIRVEYRQLKVKAVAKLAWQTPGTSAFAIIPVEFLYPKGR